MAAVVWYKAVTEGYSDVQEEKLSAPSETYISKAVPCDPESGTLP